MVWWQNIDIDIEVHPVSRALCVTAFNFQYYSTAAENQT